MVKNTSIFTYFLYDDVNTDLSDESISLVEKATKIFEDDKSHLGEFYNNASKDNYLPNSLSQTYNPTSSFKYIVYDDINTDLADLASKPHISMASKANFIFNKEKTSIAAFYNNASNIDYLPNSVSSVSGYVNELFDVGIKIVDGDLKLYVKSGFILKNDPDNPGSKIPADEVYLGGAVLVFNTDVTQETTALDPRTGFTFTSPPLGGFEPAKNLILFSSGEERQQIPTNKWITLGSGFAGKKLKSPATTQGYNYMPPSISVAASKYFNSYEGLQIVTDYLHEEELNR